MFLIDCVEVVSKQGRTLTVVLLVFVEVCEGNGTC